MLRFVIAYISTATVFLALDFVWLSNAARTIYKPRLGAMLLETPNLPVAAVFYVLYAAAIVILAVTPALDAGSWLRAALLGAILGAAAYGTYDITNLATLKNWPVFVSAVDMAWGTIVTATAAIAGYAAARYLS